MHLIQSGFQFPSGHHIKHKATPALSCTPRFICIKSPIARQRLAPSRIALVNVRLVNLGIEQDAVLQSVKPTVSDFPPEEPSHLPPWVWVAAAAGLVFALFKLRVVEINVETMSNEQLLEEAKAHAKAAAEKSAADLTKVIQGNARPSLPAAVSPLEVASSKAVVEERDLGRLILCASTISRQDSDARLRGFHEELHDAYLEHMGARVTGLLVVYPQCTLHILEADCNILFDVVRRLLPSRQFYHGLKEARVVSFETDVRTRVFSSWRSVHTAASPGSQAGAVVMDADRWVASVRSLKAQAIELGKQLAHASVHDADSQQVDGTGSPSMTTAQSLLIKTAPLASGGYPQQQQQETQGRSPGTIDMAILQQRLPPVEEVLSLAATPEADTVEAFLDTFDWDHSAREEEAAAMQQPQPNDQTPLAQYYPKSTAR